MGVSASELPSWGKVRSGQYQGKHHTFERNTYS
jgi:hypothetical protein